MSNPTLNHYLRKRVYVAHGRNGYIGIDEHVIGQSDGCVQNACLRTVISGIKPKKLGIQIADLLNIAYKQGQDDAVKHYFGSNQ